MSITDKLRGFFGRKPLTDDELRTREEARRVKDERRFRKLSQQADPRLPDAQGEIDRWSE